MKNLENIVSWARGGLKTAGFLLTVTLLIPVALIYKRIHPEAPFKVPMYFHRLVLILTGIQVRVYGKPSTDSPVLFVSNHTSYLDIPVLGSILPAGFVAKADVADWPLFGFLAKIQNTVFIERRSTRIAEQTRQLQDYMANRRNIILFPEGTSSEGLEVLPFKSALFNIVEDSANGTQITVQPVSVTCVEFDGLPMLREDRAQYAWFGDMTMLPHLWNVFQNGAFAVDVIFHTPLTVGDCTNRKELAAACQAAVTAGVARSLSQTGQIANVCAQMIADAEQES